MKDRGDPLELTDTVARTSAKEFRIKRLPMSKKPTSNLTTSSEEPISRFDNSDSDISSIAAGELVLEYGDKGRTGGNLLLKDPLNVDVGSNCIVLYVIKMNGLKGFHRSPTLNSQLGSPMRQEISLYPSIEYFKMHLDCSKCQEDSGNDMELRRFRRKVKKKLRVGENFRLYNQQGHPIQDTDLSLINQDSHHRAVVYVSQQNVMFDYETYLRMFKEVKKLGEGGYGQVFLAKHYVTWEEYAVKIISPNIMKADEASKAFKEAQVLQTLRHPNVIKLINVFQLPDTRIILFMQYYKGGSLKDYIDEQPDRKISEQDTQYIMHEVGSAINFCHQRKIVHRDIKPENIVLREKGQINKGIVIIDFGLAGDLQKMKEKHIEGTIMYAPPELMSGSNLHADPSFDVWSLGVMMYRLISGKYPFEGTTYGELRTSIVKHNPVFPHEQFELISDECIALIKLMLRKDPSKRPKLIQLIQHPWFVSHKQQELLENQIEQNTMMNFFKQEMSNIKQTRSIPIEDPPVIQNVHELSVSPHQYIFSVSTMKKLGKHSNLTVKPILNSETSTTNQGGVFVVPRAQNRNKLLKLVSGTSPNKLKLNSNEQWILEGGGGISTQSTADHFNDSLQLRKQKLNDLRLGLEGSNTPSLDRGGVKPSQQANKSKWENNIHAMLEAQYGFQNPAKHVGEDMMMIDQQKLSPKYKRKESLKKNEIIVVGGGSSEEKKKFSLKIEKPSDYKQMNVELPTIGWSPQRVNAAQSSLKKPILTEVKADRNSVSPPQRQGYLKGQSNTAVGEVNKGPDVISSRVLQVQQQFKMHVGLAQENEDQGLQRGDSLSQYGVAELINQHKKQRGPSPQRKIVLKQNSVNQTYIYDEQFHPTAAKKQIHKLDAMAHSSSSPKFIPIQLRNQPSQSKLGPKVNIKIV